MKLIGKILETLMTSYKEGKCDDLSEDEREVILSELISVMDRLQMKQDETLTTEQASLFLNVSRQTINNYVKEGKLHPHKQLGGVLQFKKKELLKMVK